MEKIEFVINKNAKKTGKSPIVTLEEVKKAFEFHKGIPQYNKTPLVSLEHLAKYVGVAGIYVKDESYRFGLNAFKVLGASYAMARFIAQKIGVSGAIDYNTVVSEETRKKLGSVTFFTATDGNHGRGVAWAAKRLKQKAVVFMPQGSSETRLANIRSEGAEASIEQFNYDDCVRKAAAEAAKVENGVVVQDTAWQGYEEIPSWIMQGYGTMALEASVQLSELNQIKPTHIFVQAGVGSLAGAVQGFFANLYPDDCPTTVVVEARAANCLYRSALAGDGKPRAVTGNLQTIMAGLACGEANILGWDILWDKTTCFVSAPDWVAAYGMRVLGNPLKGDNQVISGESGAVTAGLVTALTKPENAELRSLLKINEKSRILLFSTEGDTDPDMYRKIVWGSDLNLNRQSSET